jgi:hypothetical protein
VRATSMSCLARELLTAATLPTKSAWKSPLFLRNPRAENSFCLLAALLRLQEDAP